jgi:hypothetical protein
MTRPTLEVADILRAQGDRFLDRYRSSFSFQQLKAFRAILRCRTAALGGHRDACPSCGHQAISYNSCRNRHCPKCQAQARERWLAARERELLATSYFQRRMRSYRKRLGRLPLPTRSLLPEAFPIKASDNPGVIACCLESKRRGRPLLRVLADRDWPSTSS